MVGFLSNVNDIYMLIRNKGSKHSNGTLQPTGSKPIQKDA